MIKDHICARCQKPFTGHHSAKYCVDCVDEAHEEKHRARSIQHNARKREMRLKNKGAIFQAPVQET